MNKFKYVQRSLNTNIQYLVSISSNKNLSLNIFIFISIFCQIFNAWTKIDTFWIFLCEISKHIEKTRQVIRTIVSCRRIFTFNTSVEKLADLFSITLHKFFIKFSYLKNKITKHFREKVKAIFVIPYLVEKFYENWKYFILNLLNFKIAIAHQFGWTY